LVLPWLRAVHQKREITKKSGPFPKFVGFHTPMFTGFRGLGQRVGAGGVKLSRNMCAAAPHPALRQHRAKVAVVGFAGVGMAAALHTSSVIGSSTATCAEGRIQSTVKMGLCQISVGADKQVNIENAQAAIIEAVG
jgi:hypothetical protein